MKKISIALDGEVAAAAGRGAARSGQSLSAWLNDAAENGGAVVIRSATDRRIVHRLSALGE